MASDVNTESEAKVDPIPEQETGEKLVQQAATPGSGKQIQQQIKRHFHYGLVHVSDGKCRPQPARLKVCPDYLVLQREEFIFPDEDDGLDNKVRTVRLRRQPDGSLGISIKGGSDYNLPILVSKVCRTDDVDDDQHLYIGDAIVRVNQAVLSSATHEEAIHLLRQVEQDTVLTVKHYRSAAPFLLKNLRQLVPEQDQLYPESDVDGNKFAEKRTSACESTGSSSRKSSSGNVESKSGPVFTPVIDSPSSVTSDSSGIWNGIPRVRRKWIDVVEVPLMMAYITRYIFGTDKIRPNSFEVRGIDGSNTGVIHGPDLALLSNWIKLISDYINALTSLKGAQFNRNFSSSEQISYMYWVAEGVLNRNQPWQNWKPKFFALKGDQVWISEKPPLTLQDWDNPTMQAYKVYEAMFRVIKDSENVDERQHCFLIQTADQESRYFSLETRAELLRLESAWHRAVCSAISQMGSKTFHVVYRHLPAAFTIDWTDGFLLKPFASPNYHFIYSFSQLKSSSDDGSAKLTLLFHDHNEVVEQELICPKLQNLLFYMHAFLTAKVASLDPSFLNKEK